MPIPWAQQPPQRRLILERALWSYPQEDEKSSRVATCRSSWSMPSAIDALRLSLLASDTFCFVDTAEGLGENTGEFASSSSRGSGRGSSGFLVLGSLEGCVGYGRAK